MLDLNSSDLNLPAYRGRTEPSKAQQRAVFYEVFDAVSGLSLPWQAKYPMLETGLEHARAVEHWVVTGITRAALLALVESDFSPSVVRRAHKVGGKERGRALFTGEVSREEAFDYFIKHDRVTLTTKAENDTDGAAHWSEVFPLPPALFGWRTSYGISMTKGRKEWLAKFAELQ